MKLNPVTSEVNHIASIVEITPPRTLRSIFAISSAKVFIFSENLFMPQRTIQTKSQ
jgi:hypothetical protein